eukprot:1655194-Amphidinium_carterae.1
MHVGSIAAAPVVPFAAVLDREMLRDVIIPGEHNQLESDLQSIQEKSARGDDCAHRVRQSMHLWEWKAVPPNPAASKKNVKPPREYSGGPDDTDAMRIYLKTYGPPGTQVCTDRSNRRVQIGYRGSDFQRKSISWQSRGAKLCMKDCLTWLWQMRRRHNGESAPWQSTALE